jgi:Ni/Fe-hydrogenase subunit HybB-like protein
VAGAFTVSSLYQVFGMQRFKPVAHFALLTSLCCMLIVPVPLLLHLGHPERAFNAMITPHMSSAFAIFGFAAAFYTILLMLENWFVFRPYIVEQAQRRKGPLGLLYRALSLGSHDLSEKAMHYDRKWIFALAVRRSGYPRRTVCTAMSASCSARSSRANGGPPISCRLFFSFPPSSRAPRC